MTTRCAIYGRVSTRDKGQEVENQMIELRRFAAACGFEVAGEYVDTASGSRSDREFFQAMREDARQRKFDVVLFWSLDRFTREGVLPTLTYLNELTKWGVGWRSFKEEYLDSTGLFRDAVIAILAAVAKQERIRLSERVVAGIARARAQGKRVGKHPKVVDNLRVRELHSAGKSLRQIAEIVGVSKSLVGNILKKKAA